MAVWLITGCSSGFGDEITKAALEHGDKVIATSRNVSKLANVKSLGAATIALDINGSQTDVDATIAEAIKFYGKIDILVNNAGYALIGATEEASDEEAKAQFDTNVFGLMSVTRAVLPYMRAQKSGTIANMGSIAGWAASGGIGYYCASKFAVVGLTEALREEVAHLNIKATVIEPGYFRTNFLNADLGNKTVAKKTIDDFKPVMDPIKDAFVQYDRAQAGDPKKGAQVIVEALTGTGRAAGKSLPARLPLGKDAAEFIAGTTERHRKELDDWKELASSTDHDE
ncbi:retinol dehydrogenase [Phlyctema vagabunda]|uniref:Retinol dehydrogenase n=1 Tax=Phlyctema vagabunda TaxID=108571 RepID=A0ABR4P7B7_9HELO